MHRFLVLIKAGANLSDEFLEVIDVGGRFLEQLFYVSGVALNDALTLTGLKFGLVEKGCEVVETFIKLNELFFDDVNVCFLVDQSSQFC